MPQVEKLPRDVLDSVARQVAEALPPLLTPDQALAGDARLLDTLPLHRLRSDVERKERLIDVVESPGHWHHQIAILGTPQAFARSEFADGEASLIEVARSPLAEAVEAGVAFVQREVPDPEAFVRFLDVPSHKVNALWIQHEDRDEVFVLRMLAPIGALRPLQRYDGGEFLAQISESEPPGGLILEP